MPPSWPSPVVGVPLGSQLRLCEWGDLRTGGATFLFLLCLACVVPDGRQKLAAFRYLDMVAPAQFELRRPCFVGQTLC